MTVNILICLTFKVEEDIDTPTSSQNLPSSGSLYLPSSASSDQTGVYKVASFSILYMFTFQMNLNLNLKTRGLTWVQAC